MPTVEDVKKVRDKYRGMLEAKSNVTGTGIGFVREGGEVTKEVGIIVYVGMKQPLVALAVDDVLPMELDGIRVDVVRSKPQVVADERTGKYRPVPAGVSMGHNPLVTAGTFGCLLYLGDQRVILSNNHVLAAENKAAIGDIITQPGKYDGGSLQDEVARLIDFIPIEFGPAAANQSDAAIALPSTNVTISTEILEAGRLAGISVAALGDQVTKSGRTTGLTKGQIIAVDVEISVGYSAGAVRCVNQLEINPLPGYPKMVAGGDSGSALLTNDNKICGLVFAGDSNTGVGFANRIQPILDGLNLTYRADLAEGEPVPPPSPPPPPEKPGCNPLARVMALFKPRKKALALA